MNKRILLLVVCVFFSIACQGPVDKAAQTPPADNTKQVNTGVLKAQAQELSDAMIAGKYDRAIDLMYPKLVELSGGKERLRAGLEQQMKGIEIASIKVGEPHDIFEVNGETYAIVPTTMNMKVPEGMLVGEGYMIGFSKDKGEHWTFVNANTGPGSKEKLKLLFPAAAEKINIPAEKPPVLQENTTPQ